ncbi:MAG: molybdate ABC transporter substrate-binding protein [Clostridiaceae bacterium]|nr:molybdate ABC transporter substrate-binding protein [Clostridiaceae bacterium]
MIRRIGCLFILVVLLFVLGGCSKEKMQADKEPGEVMVFAAASLTESFTELAAEFERLESGKVKVILNFSGSQSLKISLENGAKADIFACANTKYMEELKEKGLVKDYSVFAQNRLALIKNINSRFQVQKLGDLSKADIKIAVGDINLPAGMYWEQAIEMAVDSGELSISEKSGIENNIKSRELNVKDVVSKAVLNAVDVGVVYRTDITKAVSDKVEIIDIPVFEKFTAEYTIAALEPASGNPEASNFYNFVMSESGSEILEKYNFLTDR